MQRQLCLNAPVTRGEVYTTAGDQKISDMVDTGAVTSRLRACRGNEALNDPQLLALVYAELRKLAAHQLAGERSGHTLTPTALVNEAYLRLAGDASLAPADRRQLFAIAARRMRQVLVDHARRRDASKRGGSFAHANITLSGLAEERAETVDALALDQALEALEALDPRKVRIVELRYFAGLGMSDIAELLDISRATAQRDWEVARAFLYQTLK